MKKAFRFLLILLALVLALSAFVGCNDYELEMPEEEEEDVDGDGGVDYFPDVEKNNYDQDFNFYIGPSNPADQFYMDDDTNDGSPMDEAVYNRQERVQNYLGIEIVKVTYPDAGFNNYNTYVQTAVQNMDGTMDALVTHVHGGVGALISDNLLIDLSEFEGVDLEADYWNLKFMDTIELNGNYFLGLNDTNLMFTYVIAFNKDMLALYESSMEKSIYDLVKDKEWTLDQMISIANLVYTDKTGDGKTTDDTYGITGCAWVPFCGFLTSSDIPMLAQDQSGAYIVSINQSQYFEKADALVTTIRELDASNCAYFDHDYNTISVPLTSGRALMQVQSTNVLPGMLDYNVEFGVLPYPMYDLNQQSVGYKSLQWGGYIGVLSYLKNPIMVGETLELLAFYSENVKITFYEKLLGKQVADMPDDAAMLEIIWDSVATDVGQTFITACGLDDSGVCYTVPALIWGNESNKNLASYIQGKEKAINQNFDKFLKGIK